MSTTSTGRISAFDPFDILKNETKRDVYFSRVGIYVNTGDRQIEDFSNTAHWIKLFEIYDILGNDEITVQITTDPSRVRLQTINGRILENKTDICYRMNGTFKDKIFFSEASDCALSNGTTWNYRFKYIQPSTRYLLGDIQYNVRKVQNGYYDNITVDRVPHLRYFKAKGNQNLTGPLYGPVPSSRYEWEWDASDFEWKWKLVSYLNESVYKVYNAEEDLNDIKDVWKANNRCVNVGVSPHFNPNIIVPCQL